MTTEQTLHQVLTERLSLEEVRTLCFDLGVDYDNLGGEGKSAKIRELILYLERRDRLPDLARAGERLRPDVPWRDLPDLQAPDAPAVLPPGPSAPLAPAAGSPFVVSRPLRASEPIFGREDAFRFLAGQLAMFSPVNVVAERRMGKTSLLNHLIAHQEQYLIPQPGQPPLVLACLDLQGGISDAARFYGTTLRELFDHLPHSRSREARALEEWRQQLHTRPEATYDEFERGLRQMRDEDGIAVQPVLVVDEFERLLEPGAAQGFPYPGFFNGVRALITKGLLAMVIASRLPLIDYFRDPARPNGLTSTFPSYFTPFTLGPLSESAADALLLQESDHPLTIQEAAPAQRWAGGHPCHLQAAGYAWYEAKQGGYTERWVEVRFEELRMQLCSTGQPEEARVEEATHPRAGWLRRGLRVVFVDAPMRVGRLAQRLGEHFDKIAAWIIGAVMVLVVIFLILGKVGWQDMWDVIKRGLGL